MTKQFEKIYVLDTNIILNNAHNLSTLADDNKNLIILPETVLDEIDSKKSGQDEINFQARSFARMLYDAEIVSKKKITVKSNRSWWQFWKPKFINLTAIETHVTNATIYMVSKDVYQVDSENISHKIMNDRKILEITKNLQSHDDFKHLKFISLDIMARTRAISLGMVAEALTLGKQDADSEIDFHKELYISEFMGNVDEIPEQEVHISSVEVINDFGQHFIYYLTQNGWKQIEEKNPLRLPVPPINSRQKIMSGLILDKTDVVVIAGAAGTGKTLVALSCAMSMIDKNKDKYKKIYYIRRTVISGTKEDEVGFLPGSLEEKMSGYNQPMESALKKVAKLKKRNADKEVIEGLVEDFKEKYDIEFLYAGHLRGDNFEDGSIIIMDEVQNWDITSIRTIISRCGKDSHVLAMGSNNQIDSQYLTKNTNALTFLMNEAGKENESDVMVRGVKLTKVMRSKLAEWADLKLY